MYHDNSLDNFARHWAYAVYLVCGAVLVGLALIGKRFFAGMSPGAKPSVPAWQGRLWLLVAGLFVFSAGLSIVLPGSTTIRWINDLSRIAENGYEVFVSVIVGVVGVAFLFSDRGGWRSRGRLMGLVLLIMSAFFLWDGIWELGH